MTQHTDKAPPSNHSTTSLPTLLQDLEIAEVKTDMANVDLGWEVEGQMTPSESVSASKPFRLLDLPRELRDVIYEMCLVAEQRRAKMPWADKVPEDKLEAKHYYRTPKHAMIMEGFQPPYLETHPPLLAVSRQIRRECDPIYWGKNEWRVSLDPKFRCEEGGWETHPYAPLRYLKQWVNKIGISRLRHLRDLEVDIDLHYKPSRGPEEMIRLRCDEEKGLRLDYKDFYGEEKRYMLDWHLVATECRRRRTGWKTGEAILEFFLGKVGIWNEHVMGLDATKTLWLWEEDFIPIYDRDEKPRNVWWSTRPTLNVERLKKAEYDPKDEYYLIEDRKNGVYWSRERQIWVKAFYFPSEY